MEWWIIRKDWIDDMSVSVKRFLEEADIQWITIKVFKPEQFDIVVTKDWKKSIMIDWVIEKLPDFVIPRLWAGITYFALAVIRHLERIWVFVVNSSEAIEMVKDKLYSFQVLSENNLPIPKTMLAKFPVNSQLVEEQIWFPVVIKTLSWTQWNWVFLSEDKKSFENTMNMIESVWKDKNLIFQEFIKSSKWKDLRVIVVWWKVIACMQRNWVEWDFRANYTLWWTVQSFDITPEIEWIATQSANILGLDIAWIDLLFDNGHFKICEANSSPWVKWIESCTDVNIPREVYNFIKIRLGLY